MSWTPIKGLKSTIQDKVDDNLEGEALSADPTKISLK